MTAASLTSLRLMETFRNLFYTPVYVAVSGGFFYRHGLNVMFSTMPEGGSAMEMLQSGEVDIAQTGISRSLVELDLGNDDAPLHIAEINQCDGFFLISRKRRGRWDWRMLERESLAPVGFTPVPWNSLMAAMRRHGVDPASVTLVTGLSARDAMDRFRSGDVDYVHLPHPQAGLLVDEGAGHLAAAVGPELGHICYSSFAASPQFIEANAETVQAFVSGFRDALAWLAKALDDDIVDRVAPFFAGLDAGLLLRCIRQYRAQETWPTSPAITQPSFDRMRDILIEGGMVEGRHAYGRVVRSEFARGPQSQTG